MPSFEGIAWLILANNRRKTMKTRPDSNTEKLKGFIRMPYAWPGGYPLYAVMGDGEAICKNCAKKEYRIILSDTIQGYSKQWQVIGIDVNWENDKLACSHCGSIIESAYGDSND
jgi:hypothetical protein